jgi:hypothetical protein
MSDPFTAQKQLESLMTGDTTPNMSTVDILSSLKLLNNIMEIDKASPVYRVANEETKYLSAAMHAISSNQMLSDKFGSGFQGSMTLAGLLKSTHAKQVFDLTMANVLEMSGDKINARHGGKNPFDPVAVIAKRNGGGIA